MNPNTLNQEEISIAEQVDINNEIILYNDEVNTFEHVIKSLIKFCNHTDEQAEVIEEYAKYLAEIRARIDWTFLEPMA